MVKLDVDRQGNIVLVWLDTRRDPANRLFDVFGAISTDGGRSFTPNFRVSDSSFDADLGRFVDATGEANDYLGDSIGLTVSSSQAYVAWTDTRSGNQDIYFQRVSVAPAPPAFNDRFEPNDSAAAATALGAVIERELSRLAISESDEDWIQVQSIATGVFTASILSSEAERMQLELYREGVAPVGAVDELLYDADGNAAGRRIRAEAGSGETFMIRVRLASGAGTAGYTLHVQSLTANLGTIAHREVEGALTADGQAYYLLRSAAAGAIEARLDLTSLEEVSAKVELLDAQTFVILDSAAEGAAASAPVEQGQAVLVRVASQGGPLESYRLAVSNLDQFHAPARDLLRFPAGLGPSQEAVADFNGDEWPDVAVANAGSNTVSILLGSGDGAFLAPRQFAVGAFRTPNPTADDARLNTYRRDILADDFNMDGIPDLAVTNYDSSDVSVLLGRGDGTFEPHRRFDATPLPIGLTSGDVNGDGYVDLLVVDSSPAQKPTNLAVLLGRGDGSFQPQRVQELPNILYLSVIALADLDGDQSLELIAAGGISDGIDVFAWDGDRFALSGHFDGSRQATDLIIADVNGDQHLDILATALDSDNFVHLLPGNGDGTFGKPESFFAGLGPIAIEFIDWGSETTTEDGAFVLGPPDGQPDLIVANSGAFIGAVTVTTLPEVVALPGLTDENGNFVGFGAPHRLASATQPLDLAAADFDGDGSTDLGVVDRSDFFVIYGRPPAIASNNSRENARNLGAVVHWVQPTLTITPQHPEVYYKLTAPSEVVAGAGDQALDISAGFAHQDTLGLGMEVLDVAGNQLAAGERVRVRARQGETLFIRIYGVEDEKGARGAGAYTLVINTLPQVAAVEAQSFLPGVGNRPGGPTSSLTLVLQGDRLQPETSQEPDHYRVTWLGPDRLPDTDDDRIIAIGAGLPTTHAVVYDPSGNVEVSSGRTFPTAVRQTVTLLFSEGLPAGSYRIDVSPDVQAAWFNDEEPALLSAVPGFHGHPIVSFSQGQVIEGSRILAPDLVATPGRLGDLNAISGGTRFLSQFHEDLGALLDSQLTELGDDPDITERLLDQIVARFTPALLPPGQPAVRLLVIFLDPVSIGLVDPQGASFVYDQQSGTVANQIPRAFVEVGGNVEVMVLAAPLGAYQLTVADVPQHARGGFVLFGADRIERGLFTEAMRAGVRTFTLDAGSDPILDQVILPVEARNRGANVEMPHPKMWGEAVSRRHLEFRPGSILARPENAHLTRGAATKQSIEERDSSSATAESLLILLSQKMREKMRTWAQALWLRSIALGGSRWRSVTSALQEIWDHWSQPTTDQAEIESALQDLLKRAALRSSSLPAPRPQEAPLPLIRQVNPSAAGFTQAGNVTCVGLGDSPPREPDRENEALELLGQPPHHNDALEAVPHRTSKE
jgi:hypothetical protein